MPSDDPRHTATYRRIALHYEERGDELRWTPARYRRLAAALRFTVHELGAFIRLRASQTDDYLQAGRFPPPVELHLTLIERTMFPASTPDIFPDLTTPCSSTSTS